MVRRRYYTARHKAKKFKWSVERTSLYATLSPPESETDRQLVIVPGTTIEGTRCVKNLTVELCTSYNPVMINNSLDNHLPTELQHNGVIYWALVYIPEGYPPQDLHLPDFSTQDPPPNTLTNNLYSGNQFVMSSGLFPASNPRVKIRTPLSRNLNSGDTIALLLRFVNQNNVELPTEWSLKVFGLVTYAVCFK